MFAASVVEAIDVLKEGVKYAVIQKAREFELVPWQREFESTRGKPISGVAGGQGIAWDWNGRKRGLEIS